MLGRIVFDLAVNAAFAFLVALAVTALMLRITRGLSGSWRMAVLTLPICKVVFDAARGIPDHAFFWAAAEGARADLGSFNIGFGLGAGRLNLVATLSAISDQTVYATSAGELLSRGAAKHGWNDWIAPLGLSILAISALLVARRVVGGMIFELRRRSRRAAATTLSSERIGGRSVDVYHDATQQGTPFAGGLFAPYVCFPSQTYRALDPQERAAALAHELAHVRRFDVLWTMTIAIAADLLWFCPGIHWLKRSFNDVVEQCADRTAVRRGASSVALASALVRSHQRIAAARGFSSSLGQARGLGRRVKLLLDTAAPQKADWKLVLVKLALFGFAANTVMAGVFLGNH